jgi:hypothetical protein
MDPTDPSGTDPGGTSLLGGHEGAGLHSPHDIAAGKGGDGGDDGGKPIKPDDGPKPPKFDDLTTRIDNPSDTAHTTAHDLAAGKGDDGGDKGDKPIKPDDGPKPPKMDVGTPVSAPIAAHTADAGSAAHAVVPEKIAPALNVAEPNLP